MPVNVGRQWIYRAWQALARGVGRMRKGSRRRATAPRLEELESRVTPTAPVLLSIARTQPLGPVTNASTLSYTVTFDQPVFGVNANTNFSVTEDGSVQASKLITLTPAMGPASVYTVTINGVAGSGDLRLDLVNGFTISNGGEESLSTSTAIGETYIINPQLIVLQQPGRATAGQAIGPAVQVVVADASGAPVSGVSTVTFSVASGLGGFAPVSVTSATTVNGVATFINLILDTAGSYTLTAADGIVTSAASNVFTVDAAAASSLIVAAFPLPAEAGAPIDVKVTAVDPFGNTATGYTGTVHFTSSTNQALLPADYTFQAGDRGVHTFVGAAALDVSASITVADTVVGSITGSTDILPIVPTAPSNIQLSLSAPVVVVGQPVTLDGSFADPATFDADTVTIVWGDGSANTTLHLAAQARTFSASHAYAVEGAYFPTVLVASTAGETGAGAEVQVLPASFGPVTDVKGEPGQTVTAAAFNPADGAGAIVELFLSPADIDGAELLVAKLAGARLPASADLNALLAVFDVRAIGVEAGDTALVTFFIPVNLSPNETLTFQYVDPTTGKLETFVPSKHPGDYLVLVRPNLLMLRIRFNGSSTPKLSELARTVFTISASVPGSTVAAAVSAPVASANAAAIAPVSTATFQSTSQLTLTLATSQASQVSASLSTLGDTGGGGDPSPDAEAAWLRALIDAVGDDPEALYQFGGDAALRVWMQQLRRPTAPAPKPPAPAPAPVSKPPAPMGPEAPQDKGSLREALELLFRQPPSALLRRWPVGQAIGAYSPAVQDSAVEAGDREKGPRQAPVAPVLTASLVGLGLRISERRKRKDERARREEAD